MGLFSIIVEFLKKSTAKAGLNVFFYFPAKRYNKGYAYKTKSSLYPKNDTLILSATCLSDNKTWATVEETTSANLS